MATTVSTSPDATGTESGSGGAGQITAKTNSWLTAAKANKRDEFYTQLSDIERELRHYRKHFKNKVESWVGTPSGLAQADARRA